VKRYCFDIDGVICHTQGTSYRESTPNREVIERINELFRAGHTIVLQTARGMGTLDGDIGKVHESWYDFTLQQMRSFGLLFHELFLGKAYADVYVDDKAIGFDLWMDSNEQ